MAANPNGPESPNSLINPAEAAGADRRSYADILVANGSPLTSGPGGTPAYGIPSKGARFLHVEVKVKDVGESVDVRLWIRNRGLSGEWGFHTAFGTLTVSGTTMDPSVIEISGADYVYIELLNFSTSPLVSGVDAWLGGSHDVARGP